MNLPQLTPSSRVLPEELAGPRLAKKLIPSHGTRRFVTAFTSTRHLSLSSAISCVLFPLLALYQRISPRPRLCETFRNIVRFYCDELLAPIPKTKLENNPLSAGRNRLFNIFSATSISGGLSSIRNLRTRHGVVIETRVP
jgi:hypothetical protein